MFCKKAMNSENILSYVSIKNRKMCLNIEDKKTLESYYVKSKTTKKSFLISYKRNEEFDFTLFFLFIFSSKLEYFLNYYMLL